MNIDRAGLEGDVGGVLWDEMKKIFCELTLFNTGGVKAAENFFNFADDI